MEVDDKAVVAGLKVVIGGLQDIVMAIEGDTASRDDVGTREIELMKEFDRPAGQGLTQEQASQACKRHGFKPQTVGAWARGGWVYTSKGDGRRYLTQDGKKWLQDHQQEVEYP
jgi:hypothetical protein